jgi:ribonuclease R
MSERVLAVLEAADGRSLKAKDVSKALSLSADDRGDIRQVLFDLVDDGRAVQLPGRRFLSAKAERPDAGIKGVIQRKPGGTVWFVPHERARKDAFVPPQESRGVVDGDVVLARIDRAPKGPIATIIKIVEHSTRPITGTLHVEQDRRYGKSRYVEVDDNVLAGAVRIIEGDDRAKDGDVVVVELTKPPTGTTAAEGRIVQRLGQRGGLDVEIERLVHQAGVVRAFPDVVIAEAASHGDVPGDDEFVGRDDLRDLPIVTIDGETAKDFDDAVYATIKPRTKKVDVIVCVADVSHYVVQGTKLDDEALRRGTSIYYPGRVIPMLPEALSNGLCSLRPRVPRLCTVVHFSVDEAGGVHGERMSFGVMKSRARLTYTMVQRFLDEHVGKAEPFVPPKQPPEATASTADLDDETRASLLALAEASRRLRLARRERGSLDFELPELVVELDEQKEPTGLRHVDRVESQKLIEDLMIAANEAAARFFFDKSSPSIYRIHEPPAEDKLSRFLELARPAWTEQTKKPLPKAVLDDPTSPMSLMTLMRGIGEHPSRTALDMLLLRSMKQARYSVDNVGHYGLGSTAYLHFTSPIRRYPDLIVHRLLREQLATKKGKRKKRGGDDDDDGGLGALEEIAESSSERERKAAELERQIQQLHACWLMKDRIGEVHGAVVTGVSEAGAFVRLKTLHVEGLARMDALGGEYFDFDADKLRLIGERSREIIGIGVELTVEVLDVDLLRRQIAFGRVAAPMKKAKGAAGQGKGRSQADQAAAPDVQAKKPVKGGHRAESPTPKRSQGRARGVAIDVDGDTARVDDTWKESRRQPMRSGDDRAPGHKERVARRESVAPSGIKGPDDLRALFERSGPRGPASKATKKKPSRPSGSGKPAKKR